MKNKQYLYICVIFVIALLSRIIYSQITENHTYSGLSTLEINATVIPAYSSAWGLGLSYPLQGSNIREAIVFEEEGNGKFTEPITGPVLPQITHPIGNSIIGMILYRLLGIQVTTGLLAYGIVTGSICSVLCYGIGSCVVNKRIGVLAGLIYALYPPAMKMSTDLSLLGSAAFYVLLSTWAFIKGTKSDGFSKRYIILSGVSIGLIGYFRYDWMLLAPVFPFALLLRRIKIKRILIVFGILLVIQFAVLAPLAIRSRVLTGSYRFTASTLGWVLLNGLGQYPNPWGIDGSDGARYREAEEAGFPSASSPEANEMFINRFIGSIRSQPLAYMKILARRMVFIATPYQWGIEDIGRNSDSTSFVYQRAQVGLAKSLGVALRERWPQLLSGFLMFAGLCGYLSLFWNEEKNKLAAVTVFLVFVYGFTAHFFTRMTARYLFPGLFMQTIGLAYAISRIQNKIYARRK